MRSLLLAMVVAASLAGTGARAQILTNGSFETGDFTGWTLTGNTGFTGVDSSFGGVNPTAGSYLAYFGAVGAAGYLSQTFSDTAGDVLALSFDLYNLGGTPSYFEFDFDGTLLTALTNPDAFGWRKYTFDVTGTGSDNIQFAFQQNPSYFLLDNVAATYGGSPVPEPGSMAMVAAGLGILAVMRRRGLT